MPGQLYYRPCQSCGSCSNTLLTEVWFRQTHVIRSDFPRTDPVKYRMMIKSASVPRIWNVFGKSAREDGIMNLFVILFHTGMRIGEACALGWGNIDFENELIYVRKTVGKVYIYYDESNQKLP